MGNTVHNDFEEFIIKRCEEAKLENDEYLTLERKGCDPVEVQSMAEVLCYKKALSDKEFFKHMFEM